MNTLIAITGKGGVGKTTISSLFVKQLVANDMTPVLAIDADPNSCLDVALGVEVVKTIGSAREEARIEASKGLAAGISKQEMLQMKISESLVESKGFDMISMGRPEGAGCYCYANNVLKSVIAEISSQYKYVVLDNEAGLENLSRRIVLHVDLLIIVSDPSNAGLNTVKRLYELAHEMDISYDKLLVVVNRIRTGGNAGRLERIKAETNADFVLELPDDAQIAEFAEDSRSFVGLPDDNPVLKIINDFVVQNVNK